MRGFLWGFLIAWFGALFGKLGSKSNPSTKAKYSSTGAGAEAGSLPAGRNSQQQRSKKPPWEQDWAASNTCPMGTASQSPASPPGRAGGSLPELCHPLVHCFGLFFLICKLLNECKEILTSSGSSYCRVNSASLMLRKENYSNLCHNL